MEGDAGDAEAPVGPVHAITAPLRRRIIEARDRITAPVSRRGVLFKVQEITGSGPEPVGTGSAGGRSRWSATSLAHRADSLRKTTPTVTKVLTQPGTDGRREDTRDLE